MSEEVPRSLQRSVAGTLIDLVDEDEVKIYRSAAGKAPAPPSIDLYDLEGDEEEEEPSGEEVDDDDRAAFRVHQKFAAQGRNAGWEALAGSQMLPSEEDADGGPPCLRMTLDEYFGDVDPVDQIKECRTYASALAQRLKTRTGRLPAQRRRPMKYAKKK